MNLQYLWAKAFLNLRGKAIRESSIHKKTKIKSGCTIGNSSIDRYSYCGYNCRIIDTEIASFCSISNNITIEIPPTL